MNALARILGGSGWVVAAGIVLTLVGVAMRLAAPFLMDLFFDGNSFAAMGWALAQHGEFLLPWGDVWSWSCAPAQYSHHFPPLYPALLGGAYLVAGFGVVQTKAVALLVSLAALLVVFLTTQDLFGRARAWIVTGLLAVDPHLVWATGTGFSENLVLLLFALTMWAILKSLERPSFILLAGLAAGLGYLSRAGMGAFFLLAGGAGFAWRFYYQRWRVFQDKRYLGAVAIFATIVGAWSLRNVVRFGWPHWQTSDYVEFTQSWALAHPVALLQGLGWKLPLFAALALHYVLPFSREHLASLRALREERVSGLWLAVFLVVVIGWLLASVFWTYEQVTPWWLDNRRYVVPAFLPLLWLVVRHADVEARGFGVRFGVLAVSLLLLSGWALAKPTQYPEVHAAQALEPHLAEGTQLGIEGMVQKYTFFPYLARHDIIVYGCVATPEDPCPGEDPDYILSLRHPSPHPGYTMVNEHTVRYLDGDTYSAYTYARDGAPALGPRPPGCNGAML